MCKADLQPAERERVKLASRQLLTAIEALVVTLDQWTAKPQTQAAVESLVNDNVFTLLPSPAFSEVEKAQLARKVYLHVFQRSASGRPQVRRAA